VLLVDDDDTNREFLAELLGELGYRVLIADGAPAALVCAVTEPGRLDVLCTDVDLVDVAGPTLARQLTTLRPELAVVYMTGYLATEVVDAYGLSADAVVLEKPLSIREVVRAIESVRARA
jgi:CheY-like chemotaxis protein